MFSNRLRFLPFPAAVSGVLMLLGAVIGAVVGGVPAAVGAAAGVFLVAASYIFSVLIIAWADSINPSLVLPFGMGAYIIKITWIGMIMAVLASHRWEGLPAMGIAVMVGIATWTGAQITTVVRNGPHSAKASAEMALPSVAPKE